MDPDFDGYRSAPVPVPVLGGAACRFIVEGYDDDPAPEDFHVAIRTFLALDRGALEAASPFIYAYYRDITDQLLAAGDDEWLVDIAGPERVLDHVRLGAEPTIARHFSGDRHVYVSIECECAWEPEHGLQIVFRDGATVTKVGPYDGHLTHWAAFDDDRLDGVVYPARRD
ncbi:hypothetical protein EDD30_3190 [Couchioplanes caeruleus]|uniref:DUF6985 domain-containing protein n=3 Tax=Couchioplanes caeruleus TaxID=56438 RepID=A0A1K0GR09_9ACTN|nr:hypothetical protein BG844_07700 [Couchioplanes caeruleus subsp. caeruleus]ROP30347.1 hypothetical protein EDD30_3190 [Couchioplanes caeruleus]